VNRTVTLRVELKESTEADLPNEDIAPSVQNHLRKTRHPYLTKTQVSVLTEGLCSGCGEPGSAYCGYCQGDD